MRGEKLGKLPPGMTRVIVCEGSVRITQFRDGPQGMAYYTDVNCFKQEVVPFTDSSRLTWKDVEKGTETARNAFNVFWYLYAVTSEREYFDLAERIATSCPPEWPSFILSQKNCSPIGQHRFFETQYRIFTGINLWLDLLEIVSQFGLYEIGMVKQSAKVAGLKADFSSLEPPGDKKLLTKALIAASPYPDALWITVRGKGDACKVRIHSESNGRPQAVPEFRTDFGGVQRVVVLPNGTLIRSFLASPGPQRWG